MVEPLREIDGHARQVGVADLARAPDLGAVIDLVGQLEAGIAAEHLDRDHGTYACDLGHEVGALGRRQVLELSVQRRHHFEDRRDDQVAVGFERALEQGRQTVLDPDQLAQRGEIAKRQHRDAQLRHRAVAPGRRFRNDRHLVAAAGLDCSDEPIARAVHCLDQRRAGVGVADDAPGLHDAARDHRLGDELRLPEQAQQLFARDDTVTVRDQVQQHVEHARLDALHLSVHVHFTGTDIEVDAGKREL